jgi:hypothetical protein
LACSAFAALLIGQFLLLGGHLRARATSPPLVEFGQTGIYVPVCGEPGAFLKLANLFGSN